MKEIKLEIFKAIYEVGGEWTDKEIKLAEEVYKWITQNK